MKKSRLQQQTLDRFFNPTAMCCATLSQPPIGTTFHLSNNEVINVDEEVVREVLHSAPQQPPPAAGIELSNSTLPRLDMVRRLDQQQVVFPWSPLNTRIGANGEQCYVWDRITEILREPYRVACGEDFCSLLAVLDQLVDGPGNTFEPFRRVVVKMPADEQTHLFSEVLPWMKETLLRAPTLFQDRGIPLLVQGETRRLVLSHEEIVTLMCCCFFSLFPHRSEAKKSSGNGERGGQRRQGGSRTETTQARKRDARSADTGASFDGINGDSPRTTWISCKLPCCNFSSLFSCDVVGRDASLESKIRGFIEYFFCCHRHNSNPLSLAHRRCLELTRASYTDFPAFEDSTQPLTVVSMRRSGLIENDAASLQVDFANRFVGGGVLRTGCVQEEIRMTLSPEMVLSRLVCEELAESEVLFISGAPNFCEATGYAEKFRFRNGSDPWVLQAEGSRSSSFRVPGLLRANALHPRTQEPMLIHDVCVLAMDAQNFRVVGGPSRQYTLPYLRRELHKAYVGFHGVPESYAVLSTVRTGPIATGHWGCGAFGGDKELKLLLQWCASSEVGGRMLHYYTFDTPLSDFDSLQDMIVAAGWTVGKLTCTLIQYCEYRSKVPDREAMRPFQFVEHVARTPLQR